MSAEIPSRPPYTPDEESAFRRGEHRHTAEREGDGMQPTVVHRGYHGVGRAADLPMTPEQKAASEEYARAILAGEGVRYFDEHLSDEDRARLAAADAEVADDGLTDTERAALARHYSETVAAPLTDEEKAAIADHQAARRVQRLRAGDQVAVAAGGAVGTFVNYDEHSKPSVTVLIDGVEQWFEPNEVVRVGDDGLTDDERFDPTAWTADDFGEHPPTLVAVPPQAGSRADVDRVTDALVNATNLALARTEQAVASSLADDGGAIAAFDKGEQSGRALGIREAIRVIERHKAAMKDDPDEYAASILDDIVVELLEAVDQ